VVTVVLDGENAWEYYPYNGWYFLTELYEALADHPVIRPTTFSEYLDLFPDNAAELPVLTAGSWVYGDFTTWMGDPAKNRAWDLLCAAKRAYDERLATGGIGEETRRAAELQLRSCESSDWFWWFGDYNPGESVETFDELYRAKLRHLYQLLEVPAPASLDVSLCTGGGRMEGGGVMRRGGHG
jgi:alpha-amylase/alpha-mannosidase (GH57 family)